MKVVLALLFPYLLATAFASDAPCTNAGGTCQYDSNPCSGSYQSGLCDGAFNRRCCIGSTSGSDTPCTSAGGHCQDDHLTCSGYYQSGLCSGAANRRCCIASTSSSGGSGNHNCYGTIDDLHPTGKAHGGVAASRSDVDVRIRELNSLKTCFVNFGNTHCIEPALLAAVASRETQGGALLDAQGYGDNGNGYGIMQCDIHTSGLDCTRCGPRSCCHLEMMSSFLITKIRSVQSQHSSWTKSQQLQGGVAAYNYFPFSNSFSAVDSHTTGHDYSNDVIARAQWLKNHHHYY